MCVCVRVCVCAYMCMGLGACLFDMVASGRAVEAAQADHQNVDMNVAGAVTRSQHLFYTSRPMPKPSGQAVASHHMTAIHTARHAPWSTCAMMEKLRMRSGGN